MLKARLFFIFCFTVSLLYTQQNKLSIETNSSAYSGWETYFSYNSIPSIAEGVNKIYFASYNSIFSYNIFNSQIEKFDTLNELSGDESIPPKPDICFFATSWFLWESKPGQ